MWVVEEKKLEKVNKLFGRKMLMRQSSMKGFYGISMKEEAKEDFLEQILLFSLT